MPLIVISGDIALSEAQRARLQALGTVQEKGDSDSLEAWLEAARGADVLLSDGSYLAEGLPHLRNVFVTYPFVEIGPFNASELEQNGVLVANAQGGNKDSIIEWTIFSLLSLFRKFPTYLNIAQTSAFTVTRSLSGKKVLIIGKGCIGAGVGKACEAFHMQVDYFLRQDNLLQKAADADVVINCLNCNSSSHKLLDSSFFMSLKKGSYFITFARPYTYELEGLIRSLDSGILEGAAIDCDPEPPFDVSNDFYQACLKHRKILVTPHIAFATQEALTAGPEIAVKNIESYLSGNPINILKKI